ncbi:hypothetical protein SPURM210S_07316 [Streptomyces purpurascens]
MPLVSVAAMLWKSAVVPQPSVLRLSLRRRTAPEPVRRVRVAWTERSPQVWSATARAPLWKELRSTQVTWMRVRSPQLVVMSPLVVSAQHVVSFLDRSGQSLLAKGRQTRERFGRRAWRGDRRYPRWSGRRHSRPPSREIQSPSPSTRSYVAVVASAMP